MTDTAKYNVCLVVADRGHVWVCKTAHLSEDAHWLTLTHARIVRTWGTTEGLNSLIFGPMRETVLDAPAPILNVTMRAVLYVVPCDSAKWSKYLT